jgi:hypothetical protein
MSTSKKHNLAVSELQYASHQHTLHLTTIQTLTSLYKEIPLESPLKKKVEECIGELIKPFLPVSKIEHDIIG